MIPDHLIEKAKAAYINKCGKTCSHDSLTAALEAVAADIWDQGYEACQHEDSSVRTEHGMTFIDIIPNPYRASETA